MQEPAELLNSSLPETLAEDQLSRSRALLDRARKGDTAALGLLLATHEQRLRRIVRVRLGAGLRARLVTTDIVQETYRAALASLATLDLGEDRDVLAWLARVATNRIRDEHDRLHADKRDLRRDVEPGSPASALGSASSPYEPADSATSPSEGAAQNELRELVDAGVQGLPADYRDAIVLRDYCGASWEHVTRELGRESLHATQQLHQRAWIKLRRVLEPRLRGMG